MTRSQALLLGGSASGIRLEAGASRSGLPGSSLVTCGLVSSQRGARGGYSLNKPPSEITLFQIVACLEGKPQPWGQETSLNTENLLIEKIWQEAENLVTIVLGSYTLQDLCEQRRKSRQSDSMYYI